MFYAILRFILSKSVVMTRVETIRAIANLNSVRDGAENECKFWRLRCLDIERVFRITEKEIEKLEWEHELKDFK